MKFHVATACPRPRPGRAGDALQGAGRQRVFALAVAACLTAGAGIAIAEPPVLVSREGTLGVRAPDGSRVTAPLAAGLTLHALAPLRGDDWVAAGVRDGSTLVLLRNDRTGTADSPGVARVPAPESGGGVAASPVPLSDGEGGLVGLAWLAGASPRSLEVRFAPALDRGRGSWGATETVAAAAAGSQLALSGAVLADGSALLVWSAFDGEDDEILWSRRDEGRWSEPATLGGGNRVPDITPAVAAVGEGAVAAWSRFDGGEYRLVISRWTGEGWSPPEPAGPPGSLYPTLLAGDEGAVLAYRDARRRAWTALRLESTARITARAFLPVSEAGADPVLLGSGAEGVRFVDPATEKPTTVPWEQLP